MFQDKNSNKIMYEFGRHWCDQGDELVKYGWNVHDGKHFGFQEIFENANNGFRISTAWVKRNGGPDGGDWTTRVLVAPYTKEPRPAFVSVFFYFATEYAGWVRSVEKSERSSVLRGEARDVGAFSVHVEFPAKYGEHGKLDMAIGNSSVVMLKENFINDGYLERAEANIGGLKEYIRFKQADDGTSYANTPVEDATFVAYQVSYVPNEPQIIFVFEMNN